MPTAPPLIRDPNRFQVGDVSYNGITFPPVINASARFRPEYDDSGRVTKYHKGTIRIECYIFAGCLDAPASLSGGVGSNGEIIPYDLPSSVEDDTATTDGEMFSLRQRLLEPCQRLAFTLQGVGTIVLNNPPGTQGPTGLPLPGPRDVDNGPKPKEIMWKPLTNKMAHIIWECDIAYSPCTNALGARPSAYAQFPFDVNISIDSGGLSTRTITGKVEVPLTRQATTSDTAAASEPFDMKALEIRVLGVFPMLKQFKRTRQDFHMSNDRKTVEFTIIDTEINSDDAYGPGVESEKAILDVQGQLSPGAYRRWTVSLRGSVSMMAGFPKSYAYAEIARLFRNYYILRAFSGDAPDFPNQTVIDEVKFPGTSNGKSIPILRSVKFTDEIFGRTVNYAFTWDLFCSLATLFKATGLFQPFHDKNSDRNTQWDAWVANNAPILDNAGYQGLGFTQQNDVIVSLCTPWIGPQPSTSKPPHPFPSPKEDRKKIKVEETFDSESRSTANDAKMYSAFQSHFMIDAIQSTLSHRPLGYVPIETETPEIGRRYKKDGLKYPPVKKTSDSDPNLSIINHKISPTQYVLTFKGYAVRLNHPVDIPMVKSYGGQTLTKIGTDIIRPMVLGGGVDVATGKTHSIHGLVWEKKYALPSAPVDAKIDTDGHMTQYV